MDDSSPNSISRREVFRLAGASMAAGLVAGCQSQGAGQASATPSPPAPARQGPLHELKDRVAFITGGSSGIGLGIARACAEAEMKICLTYLTPKHEAEAREQLGLEPDRYLAIRLDVTDRKAFEQAAEQVEAAFGGVHLLVNNAGVGILRKFEDTSYEDWDFVMGVNAGGVFNGLRTFLPRLQARQEPAHVLTTASMSGLLVGGRGPYIASKFAVVGMMEALRAELRGSHIGCSVLCPGAVASRIGQSARNRPSESPSVERTASSPPPEGEHLMDPLECGRLALKSVRQNAFFILTHPEFEPGLQERCDTVMASFSPDLPPAPAARVQFEKGVLKSRIYSEELRALEGTTGPPGPDS